MQWCQIILQLFSGYLRIPLFSKALDDAYPKGTLIEFLEIQSPGIVLNAFNDNATMNSVTASINKFFNLEKGYPDYVNWAMQNYGPGSGFATVDGTLMVMEDNQGVQFDNYDFNGIYQANKTVGRKDLLPDPVTNILSSTFSDRSTKTGYRAFIYRIKPSRSNPANTKTVRLKFLTSSSQSSDVPYVLTLNKSKQTLSLNALVPNSDNFFCVKRFGSGQSDIVSEIYLILTLPSGKGRLILYLSFYRAKKRHIPLQGWNFVQVTIFLGPRKWPA